MHRKVKPNPAIFIQNSITQVTLSADNANLWIENSYIGKGWKLGSRQIITGVPEIIGTSVCRMVSVLILFLSAKMIL